MEQVNIYDFKPIGKGTYFNPMTLEIKDANGNAIPLTGATLKMVAKKDVNGTAVIDFQPEVSDGANGVITIPGFIADYPVYSYVYDLFITLDGEPEKYLKGTFQIVDSISI